MMFKLKLSLLIVFLLVSVGSCTANTGTTGSPQKSESLSGEQNKSVEINLRTAWEDKIRGLDKQLKDYPLEKLNALRSLLAQVPEQQVKNEFERIAQLTSGYSDLTDYEQVFVQALIVNNLAVPNRPALVAVFSSKAPEFIGAEPVAIYLSNSKIPDPLLILFDSYEKTTNANTKKDLRSILSHAFRTLREKITGDDEFVSQSKQWYLQNYAKFELNPNYHPGSSFPDQQELFIEKSKRQPN
jgi:hypothetical protein